MPQWAFRQPEKFSRTIIYLCLGTKSKPLLYQINHSDLYSIIYGEVIKKDT